MKSTSSEKKAPSKKASAKTVSSKAAPKAAAKETKTAKATKTVQRKTNLLKLHAIMSKYSADAVDRGILEKFKIIIETGDSDITKQNLLAILNITNPYDIDDMLYEERLRPYIIHYRFMLIRKAKKNNKA